MINLAITCAGAVIGWFLKTIWEALRDLKDDIRDIENEMHTQYIRRDEVQKNFDEIKSILREIFADLKNKADK
jgi:chaperonin cofactor prefoldin